MDNNLRSNVPTFSTADINVDELLIEDSNRTIGKFRYGYRYETNITMDTHGSWEVLENGDSIWRLTIESNEAYSIGLVYNDFILPDGTTLYIYNDDEDINRLVNSIKKTVEIFA